jgi:Domain of Unknown Function (DUF1080)
MRTLARSRAVLPAVLAAVAVLLVLAAGLAAADTKDQPQPPPKDATVLFDGKDLSGWVKVNGDPPTWKVENGYMEVKGGDIMTKEKFGPDFQVHVEFWLPLMADKKDQARANSGVYLQGRYEIQVLDSYMNETYANGSVGALYGIIAPDKEAQQKAVKPPEQWNTYDITFRAPRVDDQGKVKDKGHVTVVLNGVTLIDDGTFDKVTGGALNDKLGEPGPLRLQDHGCPIRFRNIWIKPLEK